MHANWNYPTAIRFGAGRIKELPANCRELGISRPLLVTDPGLAALPVVDDVLAIMNDADMVTAVFADVRGNPVGSNVTNGVKAYRAGSHDGVIAFGGGSALDVAKAIALMVGQTRPLWDFEDVGDNYTRVNEAGMAPLVAVPTTSGTGSEVGRASVITDETDHTKKIIFHPKMLPARVICDPALTIGLPARLTAWTGMDALSHNLEAWCAPGFHPQADGIALEGMRLVHLALERAVADGTDLEARTMMMAASTMGATAFQKGLGGMHALAHPIGAVLDAHHGLTNAIVMPYVLAWNRPVIEPRLARAAAYLGLAGSSFDAFLGRVLELRRALKIPHTLADVGMTESHCAALAPMAFADPSRGGNPLPLTVQDCEELYRRATVGEI